MRIFKGIVQKGSRRGAALGYPTANILIDDTSVNGIYAAIVRIEGTGYKAAAFADPKRKILEAHILDFSEDLYGTRIEIELLEKIRASRQFENDAALRAAIAKDLEKIREYFKKKKNPAAA